MRFQLVLLALILGCAGTAHAQTIYEACLDHAVGDPCVSESGDGFCVGAENNCETPLVDGKCIFCETESDNNAGGSDAGTTDASSPDADPPPFDGTVYDECSFGRRGAFCRLSDGTVGQCVDDQNNCYTPECVHCEEHFCEMAGDACFGGADCVENQVTCPDGVAPCLVCNDHPRTPRDPAPTGGGDAGADTGEGASERTSDPPGGCGTVPYQPTWTIILAMLMLVRTRRTGLD